MCLLSFLMSPQNGVSLGRQKHKKRNIERKKSKKKKCSIKF